METAATHTYFRPVEAKDTMPANPFQKVRYQVQKVARKLMDRLPGRFLGSHTGDFLQTKQEQTKEDLRKRSQCADEFFGGTRIDSGNLQKRGASLEQAAVQRI